MHTVWLGSRCFSADVWWLMCKCLVAVAAGFIQYPQAPLWRRSLTMLNTPQHQRMSHPTSLKSL